MVQIAGYIKELNQDVVLGGETNGSIQDEKWWRTLGSFFKDGSMEFSLDGLFDTHAIHRIGTDYHKIIKNIKAFTGAGGVAHWKWYGPVPGDLSGACLHRIRSLPHL